MSVFAECVNGSFDDRSLSDLRCQGGIRYKVTEDEKQAF